MGYEKMNDALRRVCFERNYVYAGLFRETSAH